MLQRHGAVGRLGQSCAADVLILEGLMFVGITNPELVTTREVVKDAPRAEEVMNRRGHIFAYRPVDGFCIHEGLRVVKILIDGQQERRFLASSEGTG